MSDEMNKMFLAKFVDGGNVHVALIVSKDEDSATEILEGEFLGASAIEISEIEGEDSIASVTICPSV